MKLDHCEHFSNRWGESLYCEECSDEITIEVKEEKEEKLNQSTN